MLYPNIKRLIVALVPAAILFGTVAAADQTAPQLDKLFARLQTIDNHSEAQPVEQAI
jgi:hypothetical protein